MSRRSRPAPTSTRRSCSWTAPGSGSRSRSAEAEVGKVAYLLAPLRLGDASATVARPSVASAAIVALGVVHCLGRGSTIRAQAGMTALKIGILAVLAVAGLAAGWGHWENLDDRPPMTPGLLVTMASSLVYISYAYQVAWSLVLLWTASFERILIYSGVGLAVFSMLTVAAVYVLRRRRPDLPRPFRTPGYPLVPAVYLAGTGLLTAAVFLERPVVSSISLLSIAAGVPVYYLGTSDARRRTSP